MRWALAEEGSGDPQALKPAKRVRIEQQLATTAPGQRCGLAVRLRERHSRKGAGWCYCWPVAALPFAAKTL
jgi:hypothetical protein